MPNCKAYDPAIAGELAIIVDRGMREMLEEQRDVFYYVTAMNESFAQPPCRPTRTTASCAACIDSAPARTTARAVSSCSARARS